jgi:MoaA/NifB/PqqE/SkfB family radical SAM enzyme
MEVDYKFSYVNLDITNKCVLECPKCPRQTDGDLYKRGQDLSLNDFEKIAKFFPNITFCGQMSDPIYHPNFLQILKICNKHSARLTIATNGFGKKDDWWEEAFFLTSNHSRLKVKWVFGLDGLPDESSLYRINQDGEKVFETMCKGVKMDCNIHWQYIVFKYNEDHIEQAEQMALDNGITFLLMKSSRWDNNKVDLLKPSEMYLERKLNEVTC